MHLNIQNLGQIRNASIELRPLTVFVGPNGTNKTWVTDSLFSLMTRAAAYGYRSPITDIGVDPDVLKHAGQLRPFIKKRLDTALKRRRNRAAPTDIVVEFDRGELASVAPSPTTLRCSPQQLKQLIGLGNDLEASASVEMVLSQSETEGSGPERVLCALDMNAKTVRHDMTIFDRELTSTVQMGDNTLDAISITCAAAMHVHFRSANIFPTHRMFVGISPVALNPQNLGVSPMSAFAYATLLTTVHNSPMAGVAPEASRFVKNAVGGELVTRPNLAMYHRVAGSEINLWASASLLQATAGLVLYALRWAGEGDCIIIDELEMNAHPEAQLMLAELVAILVNRGIRVVMTTHSPYVLSHLNNLMAAHRLSVEGRKLLADKYLGLKSDDAVIDPQDVAVWRFERTKDGSVKPERSMDYKTGLISQSTFGNASEMVSNLLSSILSMESKPGRKR